MAPKIIRSRETCKIQIQIKEGKKSIRNKRSKGKKKKRRN